MRYSLVTVDAGTIRADARTRSSLSLLLLVITALMIVVSPNSLRAESPHPIASAESPAARDARMQWWREARFGMFIHWGLYSVAAGEWNGRPVDGVGEWILTHGQIPLDEYERLRDRFNPTDFDAQAWVSLARRAGMKYIVVTSKHHDGFCLWPSAHTEWDVAATPFGRPPEVAVEPGMRDPSPRDGAGAPAAREGTTASPARVGRDPLGELYAACEAAGIRLCLYHSIMDWHHPDYLPRRAWDERPAEDADFDRYRAHLRAQLKELLERYPNIGVLWFDGEWERTWTHDDGRSLDDFVRALAPAIIVNNRIDKGRAGMSGLTQGDHFRGDFGTPEQEIPAHGLPAGVDWESCMTMNDTWGFKSSDQNWKSTETLIRMLVDIASKGGNFLLNVGPDGQGRIPKPSIDRLDSIGRWLTPRGEAIYGTRATPLGSLPWGRSTMRAMPGGATRLYLFVLDWPADGRLRVPGLANTASRISVLGETRTTALSAARDEDALVISLDGVSRSEFCPVIAVDLAGALRVTPPPSINARTNMFVDSIEVTLSGAPSGQQIRYTLDGTTPHAASPIASGTIHLDRSCEVIARTFEGDTPRSEVARRAFTRVTPRAALQPPPSFGPGQGVRATAFERDRFARVSDLENASIVDQFGPTAIALDRRPRDEHFALRFKGFVRVPADGVYLFAIESDDGSVLRIGGDVIVDNDGLHVAHTVDGSVALQAGWHAIQLDYFNAGGDFTLRLMWEGPGVERGEIPLEAFGWAP